MIVGDARSGDQRPSKQYAAPQISPGISIRPADRSGFPGTILAIAALAVLPPMIMIILCSAAVTGIRERLPVPGFTAWLSPGRLADLAASISGPKRAGDLRAEWRTHLAGETGSGLPEDRQVSVAIGLVIAAIRYRLQDLADLLWRLADAVLMSRQLSGLLILAPTLGVSVLLIRQGGLYGLADHLEAVAVVWGAAVGLIHFGRNWRDVKPPKHKARRKSE